MRDARSRAPGHDPYHLSAPLDPELNRRGGLKKLQESTGSSGV